jgi:hypothetical protein
MKQKKQLTKQETFDKVATHLLTQGRKAMDQTGCVYLAADCSMCAAGCLIPKRRYRKGLEGTACQPDNAPGRLIASLGHDLPLVQELQEIHDHAPVYAWPVKLKELAANHGLSNSVLSKLLSRLTLKLVAA